ncbi:hypothetical protein COO91_04751 [Nostoc flagelliforme CCNUN1]|uniref:Uncharacterized protein n=1 Tax=Nostoc flagelliforme CCNUN1 TaxID=2038116 RepID=A0A2K8STK4_9NOSO|nr:hypothetical protein COO91_04751 [Nostoc flagelliforme CCNUN1]
MGEWRLWDRLDIVHQSCVHPPNEGVYPINFLPIVIPRLSVKTSPRLES